MVAAPGRSLAGPTRPHGPEADLVQETRPLEPARGAAERPAMRSPGEAIAEIKALMVERRL